MQPTRLPRKKDVALALLEQSTVFVHLDPRDEPVRVPTWLKRQPQLVLQIGLNMAIPIPDLQVDEEGLSCTLSFNRAPHFCSIPWSSVFALVGDSGRGMVWPDDVPPEVAEQAEKQAKQAKAKATLKVAVPPPAEEAPRPAAKRRRTRASGGATPAPTKKGRARAKPATAGARPAAALKPAVAKPAAAAASPAKAASAAGNDKRKRELPPYLRVVK